MYACPIETKFESANATKISQAGGGGGGYIFKAEKTRFVNSHFIWPQNY